MKDGDFECSDGLNYEFRRRKNTQDSPQKEHWAEQLNREPTVASGLHMLNTHYPEIYYTIRAR